MKKYRVLVLAMSTLPDPLHGHKDPFKNIYKYQRLETEDDTIYRVRQEYRGIGQLEPVPQYLLDRYGEITHYVILATKEAKASLSYPFSVDELKTKIRETGIGGEITFNAGETISAVTFFEKRVEAFHKEKTFMRPCFKDDICLSEDKPEEGIEELMQYIRNLYKDYRKDNKDIGLDEDPDQNWKLYVDIHGGLRAMSFIASTLIQVLSMPDLDEEKDVMSKEGETEKNYIARLTDGRPVIPVTKIYTINYDNSGNNISYIVDQTKLYDVYSRESIEAYMNYGQYAQMALRSRIDPFDATVKPYAFISYRRTDAPKERFTFIGSLKQAGFRYWYDDSIPVLEDWKKTLEQANSNCKIFIALISKEYFNSFQCVKELTQAIQENKQIFLVSIDQTPLYLSLEEGKDSIYLTNGEKEGSGKFEHAEIKKSDLEEIKKKQHQALDNNMRDGIFQPSALIDKLSSNSEFQALKEN